MKKILFAAIIAAMIAAKCGQTPPGEGEVAYYYEPGAWPRDTVPHPWHNYLRLVPERYHFDQQPVTVKIPAAGRDTFERAHPDAKLIWEGPEAIGRQYLTCTLAHDVPR